MKAKRKRTSPASTDPSTIGSLLPSFKSLHRQHQITLRRLDNIQRQLDGLPCEDVTASKRSLVEWFRRLARK